MSEAMPEDAIEYWDVTTRTYYERQEDGTVLSRPYNEAENTQADARTNRAVLVERILAACRVVAGDASDNAAYLDAGEPSTAALLGQVAALTRQSNRQGEELAALARLVLGRLDSTEAIISE
ncbi:hypothetical protein ACIRPS_17865 [Streptomyces griseoviridis]